MKKWIALSVIVVFGIYGLGLYVGWDMFIPLWILLAACGLVFWISDGMSIRAANHKNYSFLDINNAELDYAESTRRKASQDKSPVSTIIVSVGVAATICLGHCYMFAGSDKLVHEQNYGVRYVQKEVGQKESSVRINLDMNDSKTITALCIVYQSQNSYNADAVNLRGIYADDTAYGNSLPIVYFYKVQESGYLEMIFVNFYMKEFENEEKLIQYLGLDSEWSDGVLSLDELKASETFRFKDILEKGEYSNNISFAGESKYNVE